MKPALTHLALQVHDVERSVEFYQRYCGLKVVHERPTQHHGGQRVVWLAEPGHERQFVLVFVPGESVQHDARDVSHLGFALESPAAVDEIAELGRKDGCLVWEPCQEAYPVGYYCALEDPDGNRVEFSYGQPLGPGAPD